MDTEKDFAENTFVKKIPSWIRWILFLPAAVAGSVVLTMLMKLVYSIGISGGWMFLVDYAQSYFLGLLFVGIGAIIAPSKQFAVGLILMILITILSVLIFQTNFITQTSSTTAMLIHCILVIAGGGTVIYTLYENKDSDTSLF